MTTSPEMPPEVQRALLDLATDPRRVMCSLRPWDAWVTVAVIQFACRNPQLNPTQREQAERVGRALQAALAELAPETARYLELGWDPTNDMPRRRPGGGREYIQ